MRDPVVALRRRGSALALTLLAAAAACDADNVQRRLQDILSKQAGRAERQATREAAKTRGVRQGLPKTIADALDLVAASDARFVVSKSNGKVRVYSGTDFAAMLTSKTVWLGRGIDELPAWIEEIGRGSFMGHEDYMVRRPDGETEPFGEWIARQIERKPVVVVGAPEE